ncbi:MAG TPA: SIMPL domain-containing protein [Vicinamibacterales bacterium]
MKAIAAMALALALPLSAAAQQNPQANDLSVVVTVGEGIVKRAPDQAWVTIAAESRAKTPTEAQKLNADAMSAVMAKLKGLGLPADAIQTSAYELRPEFDYVNNRQTLRGYLARNAVEVRVDELAKLGQVLDLAVTAGATSVGGVRFDLKDRASVEQIALQRAVTDARAQATTAAQAAGMKVERVIRIDVGRDTPMPPPRPMLMRAEMAVAGAEPPIAPGELEIKAMVTMTAVIR